MFDLARGEGAAQEGPPKEMGCTLGVCTSHERGGPEPACRTPPRSSVSALKKKRWKAPLGFCKWKDPRVGSNGLARVEKILRMAHSPLAILTVWELSVEKNH